MLRRRAATGLALIALLAACRHPGDAPASPPSPGVSANVLPPPPPPLPPPPPPKRPGAQANVDPGDDLVVGPPDPVPDCVGELARAGVTFRPASLPVYRTKNGMVCGAPEVVTYVKGPGNIAYNAPPTLTCRMALALATFERVVQESAQEAFGSSVARINQVGTYACREVAAFAGLVSEHSYANALDIGSFVLKNGKTIDVLTQFEMAEPPQKPAGRFLRAVSRRAHDEDVFSVVLTPFFNVDHNNHFHLDLARYRRDGTRPR